VGGGDATLADLVGAVAVRRRHPWERWSPVDDLEQAGLFPVQVLGWPGDDVDRHARRPAGIAQLGDRPADRGDLLAERPLDGDDHLVGPDGAGGD
jgi:hypothetical protein